MPRPCDHIISDNQIENIYNNCHAHVSSVNVHNATCITDDCKEYNVELQSADNKKINIALQRQIENDCQLKSNESMVGKVAHNKFFALNDEFKKKGIGKAVHQRECIEYANIGVQEIQITAYWDGVVFWPLNHFKIEDESNDLELCKRWFAFVRANDGLGKTELETQKLMRQYSLFSKVISDILSGKLQKNMIEDFSLWLKQKGIRDIGVSMFKTLGFGGHNAN